MDIRNLKLVIWDLDDTFWDGTITEGGIRFKEKNIKLLKDLTDRGIINSICSKNDEVPVINKLRENGLNELFVFNSIDWTPKGPRISEKIKEIGLRPQNILFIDDNIVNLNEAKFYNPDINIATPEIIDNLILQVSKVDITDPEHKRLKQYQILQKKEEKRKSYTDNESFLYASNIIVEIHKNTIKEINRIHELIERTNQLNYTKKRISKEDLQKILVDPSMDTGYITVKDNFGYYGVVGFYALKEGELIHFLFSCRTIGQGVEQWVYSTLGYPKIEIVGDVIENISNEAAPKWINQNTISQPIGQKDKPSRGSTEILLKGPCDMSAILPYIERQPNFNVHTEFNYVGSNGAIISSINHTVHIIQGHTIDKNVISDIIEDAPFLTEDSFNSVILDKKFDFIFFSMLPDSHEGVYKHKESGILISFSSFNYDLTDKKNWDKFISGEFTNHNFNFTREILERFSDKFEFIGPLPVGMIIDNLKYIINNIIPAKTHVILLLGSEKECLNERNNEFANHAIRHKEINLLIKEQLGEISNVDIINFTDFIKDQKDFAGVTNHFSRRVYYEVAKSILYYVNKYNSSDKFVVRSILQTRIYSFLKRINKKISSYKLFSK